MELVFVCALKWLETGSNLGASEIHAGRDTAASRELYSVPQICGRMPN
jgi:hypothetical protein